MHTSEVKTWTRNNNYANRPISSNQVYWLKLASQKFGIDVDLPETFGHASKLINRISRQIVSRFASNNNNANKVEQPHLSVVKYAVVDVDGQIKIKKAVGRTERHCEYILRNKYTVIAFFNDVEQAKEYARSLVKVQSSSVEMPQEAKVVVNDAKITTLISELQDMSVDMIQMLAQEFNVDLGRATTKNGMIKKFKSQLGGN